jgi:hypothetical protein
MSRAGKGRRFLIRQIVSSKLYEAVLDATSGIANHLKIDQMIPDAPKRYIIMFSRINGFREPASDPQNISVAVGSLAQQADTTEGQAGGSMKNYPG